MAIETGHGRTVRRWLLWAASAAMLAGPAAAAEFERPAGLERDIEFWRRVYTEVTTQQGFLHDSVNLGVVYATLDFPAGASRRERERRVEAAKRDYREILRALSSGKRQNLSDAEQQVLALWGVDVDTRELRAGMDQMRFQLGQADKFREGLIRSGRWESYIRKTFQDMGLPVELAVLPHVESSFNPGALSHVGATGLWQFTRDTGRRFMRIDHVVDERLDPFRSTIAAARLLEQNFAVTGTWPLALTAYNHGASGMRRARQQLGTTDIETIVRGYRGRTFGFASRNFYVAFLAALDVNSAPEQYFGALRRDPPDTAPAVEVADFISVASLEAALGVDRAALRRHNPSLLPAVWNGNKHVPRGFQLRVPHDAGDDPAARLAAIPATQRYAAQTPDLYHTVRRGDTLSGVAAHYGIRLNDLLALNNLANRHRIRIGQVLRLPGGDAAAGSPTLAEAAEQSEATGTPEDGVYVVRRGDTLSLIARRLSISEETLLAVNDIRNRNWIYEGQRLRTGAPAPVEPADARAEAPAAETIIAAARPATESAEDEPAASETDAAAGDVVEPAAEPALDAEVLLAAESAEPTTADEAPAPLTAAHAALSADPSDYSVGADSTIEIQAAETLGHYAEWLDLRASRLRQINRMSYGTPVVVGRRLKLDFARVAPQEFENRRMAYHQALQQQFFTSYRIDGTEEHVVQAGESVWVLSQRRYQVPVWLLRQYNPDLELSQVRAGARVVFPVLQRAAD